MRPQSVHPVFPIRWLFVGAVCLYALSIGRGFYSSDGEVMFQTARALALRGSFALAPDPGLPQIVSGSDGRHYSKYDPGLPLLAVPLVAGADWVARTNAAHRTRTAAVTVLLLPALAGAGTVAALALLARDLGYGDRRALGVAIVAGLATPLWPYARMLFAEAVLACALTSAVLLIGRGRPGAAGLVFAVGISTRAALAIYVLPLAVLALATAPDQRAGGRRALTFGLGLVPGAALLLWHNHLRFDDPFQFGYGGERFSTSLIEGVAGLLISPGKSVLFYAPPLMLSALAWPRLRRRHRVLADCLALMWLAALIFYGTWWAWHGGWAWGPRLLVPLLPLSCLPLLTVPVRRGWRVVLGGVVGGAIAGQVLAVMTDFVPHYAAAFAAVPDVAGAYHRLHWWPAESPLVAAGERWISGQWVAPGMLHLADTGLPPTWVVGVPLALLAGVLTGGGRVIAWWHASHRSVMDRVRVRIDE